MMTLRQYERMHGPVTLQRVRAMDLYREIEQPPVVYHMTARENLEAILKAGKITSRYDFMTYFFPDLESIPVYILATDADQGRMFWHLDGRAHKDKPLKHDEMVVLELRPRGVQALEWYKEDNVKNAEALDDDQITFLKAFDNSRLCHYRSMRFRDDPKVIELTEVDQLPKSETLSRLKGILAKKAGGILAEGASWRQAP